MEHKICVYAISKNESKQVNDWLNSMGEADYIVVLDTGSSDDTIKKLKKDPRVTKVEKKEIKPWRFDVARNESMKLIPEDADILVCTDLDERFEAGWAQVLRNRWEEKHNRCFYTYAWSHNELGEPQDIFIYDKIHTRDYHWVYPVHEVLMPINDDFVQYPLEVGEDIYLHHLQDSTKDRKSYFDLLKISVKENPEDSHVRMLMAREYAIRQEWAIALEEYKHCLTMEDIEKKEKILVKLETIGRIGDMYLQLGDYDNAIVYYNKFIELDSTYREPYFCLAEIYNDKKMYLMAKAMVELALNCTHQKYNWIERKDNWLYKAEDILSISKFYTGDLDGAIECSRKVVQHSPNDARVLKNYIYFLETKYCNNN